jgi:hypothetical protein
MPRTVDGITQCLADWPAVRKKLDPKIDLGCAFGDGFPLN